MYRLLGNDQKEYGPVSLDAVKQWIAERRANARSLARAEGGADWKPLAEFPEFSAALAAAARPPSLPILPAHAGAGAVLPAAHSALAIASLVLGLLGFCSAGLSALVGLILGIVALVRIRQSEGRLGGQGFAIAGICVSGFFLLLFPILLGLLLPAFAKAKSRAQGINCVNNLKQLGLAMRIYSNDHQDKFAAAENWCDVLLPSLGSPKMFQCYADQSGQRCSYAFNARLSGMDEGKINPKTVLFFEIDGGWNVSGGPSLVLSRPRHTFVSVCFADGPVAQVNKSGLSGLRWDP